MNKLSQLKAWIQPKLAPLVAIITIFATAGATLHQLTDWVSVYTYVMSWWPENDSAKPFTSAADIVDRRFTFDYYGTSPKAPKLTFDHRLFLRIRDKNQLINLFRVNSKAPSSIDSILLSRSWFFCSGGSNLIIDLRDGQLARSSLPDWGLLYDHLIIAGLNGGAELEREAAGDVKMDGLPKEFVSFVKGNNVVTFSHADYAARKASRDLRYAVDRVDPAHRCSNRFVKSAGTQVLRFRYFDRDEQKNVFLLIYTDEFDETHNGHSQINAQEFDEIKDQFGRAFSTDDSEKIDKLLSDFIQAELPGIR